MIRAQISVAARIINKPKMTSMHIPPLIISQCQYLLGKPKIYKANGGV